ncbi:hypothetical protein M0R45_028793 [Rubus argutus]|uniref:PID domain-containing protein n=1 Tax=Rubus argutus TaxID=59490 RepID=A0AAW1WAF7_RUBAR
MLHYLKKGLRSSIQRMYDHPVIVDGRTNCNLKSFFLFHCFDLSKVPFLVSQGTKEAGERGENKLAGRPGTISSSSRYCCTHLRKKSSHFAVKKLDQFSITAAGLEEEVACHVEVCTRRAEEAFRCEAVGSSLLSRVAAVPVHTPYRGTAGGSEEEAMAACHVEVRTRLVEDAFQDEAVGPSLLSQVAAVPVHTPYRGTAGGSEEEAMAACHVEVRTRRAEEAFRGEVVGPSLLSQVAVVPVHTPYRGTGGGSEEEAMAACHVEVRTRQVEDAFQGEEVGPSLLYQVAAVPLQTPHQRTAAETDCWERKSAVVAPSPSSSVLALPQTASSPDLGIAEEDYRDEHKKSIKLRWSRLCSLNQWR